MVLINVQLFYHSNKLIWCHQTSCWGETWNSMRWKER